MMWRSVKAQPHLSVQQQCSSNAEITVCSSQRHLPKQQVDGHSHCSCCAAPHVGRTGAVWLARRWFVLWLCLLCAAQHFRARCQHNFASLPSQPLAPCRAELESTRRRPLDHGAPTLSDNPNIVCTLTLPIVSSF